MNKVKYLWSILCEKGIVDGETNSVSLVNVLESIQIQIAPMEGVVVEGDLLLAEKNVPLNFELITLWERIKPGDIREVVRVEHFDPNGKKLGSYDYRIEMPKTTDHFRSRIRFNGFKLTVPGSYRFVSKVQKGSAYREVGSVHLDVKIGLPKAVK